jgi:hypothetical protein
LREGVADDMPDANDQAVVKSTNEARQGVTGHNVRYVLFFSVGAVVVLLAGIYLYYFAN